VIDGKRYVFGVSGLLYKRNMLFFDRETDSLWSQLLSRALTGPLAGAHLTVLPAENATWGEWRAAHPNTSVMSSKTGYQRDYKQDPYANILFSRDEALLVSAGGETKIYPFSELKKAHSLVDDEVGGARVSIAFDARSKTARVKTVDSTQVTSIVCYLHDLKAFYPAAKIFRARRK